MLGSVIPFELSAPKALQLVRAVAKDSSRVVFGKHAEARMVKHGITRTQVFRCLMHGKIMEGPSRDIKGGWRMTMDVLTAGDIVRVIAILDHDDDGNYVVVITTHYV